MAVQKQEQQPDKPKGQAEWRKRIPWIRLTIVIIIAIIVVVVAVVGLFGFQGSVIITILGIIIAVVQWLLPISPGSSESAVVSPPVSPPPLNPVSSPALSPSPEPKPKTEGQGGHPMPVDKQTKVEIAQIPRKEIFLFNEPLLDSDEFYGRTRERTTLINRTRNGASTSIVGPRRIGKTWLIDYLRLVAPTELGARFRIAHMDATAAGATTVAKFTAKVLKELGYSDRTDEGLDRLENVVEDLKSSGKIPVLCIDEFEGFDNPQEFNLGFFTKLRAMTQTGLVLVIGCKRPLIDIVGNDGHTSGFFNVFEQLTLKPFSQVEAEEFTKAKAPQAGFDDQERIYLLKYGREYGQKGEEQWPPMRLQLVGKMLLYDKVYHFYHPDDPSYWKKFEEELIEKYQGVVR